MNVDSINNLFSVWLVV